MTFDRVKDICCRLKETERRKSSQESLYVSNMLSACDDDV